MAKKITQEQQVIDALREQGGYATLGELYHLVDTRLWATKTPNETIRRIVQVSNEIFKIQSGLWALEITNRARTVDVIWFNERLMPHTFFEVEHSTDFQNSLGKFCDLQDFYCRFFIVAPRNRRKQFEEILTRTAFRDICKRVKFNTYDDISKQYEAMCVINKFNCI